VHPLLVEYEERLNLNVTDAAKLLGYHRVSYYQLRARNTLPSHTERMISIILSLPQKEIDRLLRKYVGEPDDEL
jgi:hypothetical protein